MAHLPLIGGWQLWNSFNRSWKPIVAAAVIAVVAGKPPWPDVDARWSAGMGARPSPSLAVAVESKCPSPGLV